MFDDVGRAAADLQALVCLAPGRTFNKEEEHHEASAGSTEILHMHGAWSMGDAWSTVHGAWVMHV